MCQYHIRVCSHLCLQIDRRQVIMYGHRLDFLSSGPYDKCMTATGLVAESITVLNLGVTSFNQHVLENTAAAKPYAVHTLNAHLRAFGILCCSKIYLSSLTRVSSARWFKENHDFGPRFLKTKNIVQLFVFQEHKNN